MKKILVTSIFLLSCIFVKAQNIQGDSVIILTPEEARVLTKMTEDLKYTRKELSVCDSIITHQKKEIKIQESIIEKKDKSIEFYKSEGKRKTKKAGFLAGIIGLVVGFISGLAV